ncbi:MAG: hypothetical protein ACI4I7_03650, partial [Oscillospiraceae bacterium]
YYKTSANGKWIGLTTTTGTSYTKTGLTAGKTYYFTVKAYRNVGGKTYNGSFTTKSVYIPKPVVTTPVQSGTYYLNPDSMKVHHSSGPTIKNPNNYIKSNDLNQALNNGYQKCKVCF